VNEAGTAAPGSIGILVSPYNTTSATPAAGAPTANAIQNILNATHQNDVVTQLSVTPASQAATAGTQVPYVVTATNGATSAVQAAKIYYTVTSAQGNSVGQDNVQCQTSGTAGPMAGTVTGTATTDQFGKVTCYVTAPATVSSGGTTLQSGPYTVTFRAPHTNATTGAVDQTTGPTTTATLNSAAPAPAGSTVDVSCTNGQRNDIHTCYQPTSDRTENFTATVTSPPATTGGARQPVSGVVVNFSVTGPTNAGAAGTETGSLNPTSCVTGADGTCGTTLTISGAPNNGDTFTVHASVPLASGGPATSGAAGSGTSNATVTFTNVPPPAPATNVSISAANASPTVGTSDTVTAAVTNQTGASAGPGIPVTFTITGQGTFTDGTTTKTANTGPDGTVQEAITSATPGSSTVTATLNSNPNSAGGTNCAVANNGTPTSGGMCQASTTVTWQPSSGTTPPGGGTPPPSKTKQHPSLSCTSPAKGVLKCTIQTNPAVSGLTVTMHRYTNGAPGNGYTMAGNHTSNGRGRVFLNAKPKPGNILHLIAYVHGNGSNAGNWTQHITITISK
jgi:hypothetical protein